MIAYIVLGVIVLLILVVILLYLRMRSFGSISLEIDKVDYKLGEIIKGKIKLNLKKPVEAKALNVRIEAVLGEARYNIGGSGVHSDQSSRKIFEQTKIVEGEKLYSAGENLYDFEIKLPDNLNASESILASLFKGFPGFAIDKHIEWNILAYLDLKGFDLKKNVKMFVK